MARLRSLAVPAALLTLAACAATPKPQTAPAAPPPARISTLGLEGVLGKTSKVLEATFGTPALDVREGNGRKLQFASPACVLDAYLYPPAAGGDALVTWLDARLPDGRDFDRASCVAAISAQRQRR